MQDALFRSGRFQFATRTAGRFKRSSNRSARLREEEFKRTAVGHNGYAVVDSFFQKKRKGAWRHPLSKEWVQLDMFLISDVRRITDAETTAWAFESDHRMVRYTVDAQKLRRKTHREKASRKIDVAKLEGEALKEHHQNIKAGADAAKTWEELAEVLYKEAEESVGYKRAQARPQWQEDNSKALDAIAKNKAAAYAKMQEAKRRIPHKKAATTKAAAAYRQAKKDARSEVRKILNDWWKGVADRMEEAHRKGKLP